MIGKGKVGQINRSCYLPFLCGTEDVEWEWVVSGLKLYEICSGNKCDVAHLNTVFMAL